MHFCFCCPISLDSSLAQWSKLFLNSDPNSFRQVGLIICVIGTRATTAHFSRQDRYSSGHITSMPPLPPCSILQNPGKTAVLLVLPLKAALGTCENISVIYQFYKVFQKSNNVPTHIGSFRRPVGFCIIRIRRTLMIIFGYWFKTLCFRICELKMNLWQF